MKLWDFVNDINGKQANILEDCANPDLAKKVYVPFIINKQMSYFPDTILYAQQMNLHHHAPNDAQYFYYLNSIRPRKRFCKWSKRQESEDIDLVRRHYGYDINKAEQALSLLSPDDLQNLREKYDTGGL